MIGSWTDWELTEFGKQQALNIGRSLSAELTDTPLKIYCSDLKRAQQTATPLAKLLSQNIEFRRELREQNLGEACGKTKEWAESHSTPTDDVDVLLFNGAESLRDVWNRLVPFYSEILASTDETIVIVSHGLALQLFNSMLLGLSLEQYKKYHLHGSAGGVTKVNLKPDGICELRRFSDMSYSKD
jgi:probable phosphoglycerate mutase